MQPGSTSVALNRVWDPKLNPSRILGTLQANGQVYLINRNGILFGQGARIDVSSLVASTLDISDATFNLGLLSAINQPSRGDKAAFQGDGRAVVLGPDGTPAHFAVGADGKPERFRVDASGAPVLDAEGNKIPDAAGRYIVDPNGATLPVEVTIAAGAELKADSGGRVMVFGQNVRNDGSIETPDGQTILAAGNRVYLLQDAQLRGLLVEVDTTQVDPATLQAYLNGDTDNVPEGTVTNGGAISAPRGDATLMGLAVNQQGRVSATSALDANGSIRLLARSSGASGPTIVEQSGFVQSMLGTETGRVVLGEDSSTRVGLDTERAADTAVDEQTVLPSTVEAAGQQIEMRAGAEIVAPSGKVSLAAVVSPSEAPGTNTTPEPDAWVRVDAGSRINVKGTDVTLPMSRNQVSVELRGTELADSPLQRDGVLYGQTVNVDLRTLDANGKIPIADISGAFANIRRTLAERDTPGGDVAISSVGAVDMASGSTIDASGGTVHYESGTLSPTQLLSDGQVFDIGTADPNRHYDAVLGAYTQKSSKWGVTQTWSDLYGQLDQYVRGFDAGADAGSVQVQGYSVNLDGTLQAAANAGPFQREPFQTPLGGLLVIGDPTGGALTGGRSYRAPNVVLVGTGGAPPGGEGDNPLVLDLAELTRDGFDRTRVFSNGRVTLAGDAALAVGGELSLTGAEVVAEGSISAPGGRVALDAEAVDPAVQLTQTRDSLLQVADGVTLDTGGRWTNDTDTAALANGGAARDPVRIDGGEISLALNNSGNLVVGNEVTLDASAGAWLSATGQLTGGRGGQIGVVARPSNSSGASPSVTLGDGLALEAYALSDGGRLDISLPNATIGAQAGDEASGASAPGVAPLPAESPPVTLPRGLFDTGGFSAVGLDINRGDLQIAGVALQPVLQNFVLEPGYEERASGAKLADLAQVETLPAWQRGGVDVSLSVSDKSRTDLPALNVDEDSTIALDPRSNLKLFSTGIMNIDGVLSAPAGSISLDVTNDGPQSRIDYNANRVLQLGRTAVVTAAGLTVPKPDPLGLRRGDIFDGGSISISGEGAYVNVAAGAVLDVSGASKVLDSSRPSAVTSAPVYVAQRVDSDAGSIDLSASEGIRFDGIIEGHGGGTASKGAALTVDLNTVRAGFDLVGTPIFANEHSQPRQLVLTVESNSRSGGVGTIDGKAVISAPGLASSGVDALTLRSADEIVVDGPVDLALGRSLRLDAPLLRHTGTNGETASLDAPYIGIGPDNVNRATPVGDTSATGTLVLGASRAALVDLIGRTNIVGFTDTTIRSAGDIRLVGLQDEFTPSNPDPVISGLVTFGTLTLQGDQLYPTTLSKFDIESLDLPAGPAGIRPRLRIDCGAARRDACERADPRSLRFRVRVAHGELDRTGRCHQGAARHHSAHGHAAVRPADGRDRAAGARDGRAHGHRNPVDGRGRGHDAFRARRRGRPMVLFGQQRYSDLQRRPRPAAVRHREAGDADGGQAFAGVGIGRQRRRRRRCARLRVPARSGRLDRCAERKRRPGRRHLCDPAFAAQRLCALRHGNLQGLEPATRPERRAARGHRLPRARPLSAVAGPLCAASWRLRRQCRKRYPGFAARRGHEPRGRYAGPGGPAGYCLDADPRFADLRVRRSQRRLCAGPVRTAAVPIHRLPAAADGPGRGAAAGAGP